MAIKYVRKGFRESARGTHGQMDGGVIHRRRLSPKQRLLGIYLALLAAVIALLLFRLIDPFGLYRPSIPERGEGVILRKFRDDARPADGPYFVEVQVRLKDGRGPSDVVPVDPPGWEAVSEGDRVEVDYRINRARDAVRIQGIKKKQNDET